MATTDLDAELADLNARRTRTIATVDSMLKLIGNVRAERVRDPLRRLEDLLLELRLAP